MSKVVVYLLLAVCGIAAVGTAVVVIVKDRAPAAVAPTNTTMPSPDQLKEINKEGHEQFDRANDLGKQQPSNGPVENPY